MFGNETFVGGFADFSSLAKVRIVNTLQIFFLQVYWWLWTFVFQSNGDPFDKSTNINLFKENTQSDVPPALPPKTGTPTRPPPPPPGQSPKHSRFRSAFAKNVFCCHLSIPKTFILCIFLKVSGPTFTDRTRLSHFRGVVCPRHRVLESSPPSQLKTRYQIPSPLPRPTKPCVTPPDSPALTKWAPPPLPLLNPSSVNPDISPLPSSSLDLSSPHSQILHFVFVKTFFLNIYISSIFMSFAL